MPAIRMKIPGPVQKAEESIIENLPATSCQVYDLGLLGIPIVYFVSIAIRA